MLEDKIDLTSNKSSNRKKIYVLDASAIFNGFHSRETMEIKYFPECITREIQGALRGEVLLAEISQKPDLVQAIPSKEALKHIQDQAYETGDLGELSSCDIEVLALAYSLKEEGHIVEIISDDYDIQNLASYLSIKCKGIYWKGISSRYHYYWICIGCGFKSKDSLEYCTECGSLMKKRTIKRKLK